MDARHQLFVVSAGQVPTPNPSGKKDITTNQEATPGEIRTKASGTMAGHVEDPDSRSQPFRVTFLDEGIERDRLDLQLKSPPPEKFAIRHHGSGQRVPPDRALVPLLDGGSIGHMIEMPVREDEQGDGFFGKGRVRTLGRIKENPSSGCLHEEGIGIERPAGENARWGHGASWAGSGAALSSSGAGGGVVVVTASRSTAKASARSR